MADKKISELTAHTTSIDLDELVIVDKTNTETKKITKYDFLKGVFRHGVVALSGAVNGVNKVFTLPYTPYADEYVAIFKSGYLQTLTEDYTISGADVTFVDAPEIGMNLRAIL